MPRAPTTTSSARVASGDFENHAYSTSLMGGDLQAPPLAPALATAIGSLPHTDPHDAAQLVLHAHPRFPAAPQLPARTPLEGIVAQWARALPEVTVRPDGSISVDGVGNTPPVAVFDDEAHAGLLAFLAAAGNGVAPPPRVKVQIAGPLTIGLALKQCGVPASRACRRGGEAAGAWAIAVEELVDERLPRSSLVLFFDEPALVAWRHSDTPIEHEARVDGR